MTTLTLDATPARDDVITCAHCGAPAFAGRGAPASAGRGQPTFAGRESLPESRVFCCPGCEVAFDTIQSLGLGDYYERCIAERPPRPERSERIDLTRFITARADGTRELTMAIDGLRCGACVWLIESVLGKEQSVQTGRVNMTSRRLKLIWRGADAEGERLAARVEPTLAKLLGEKPIKP